MTDGGELIRRCRAGDALAWEEFVRVWQGRIYGIARQYLRDPEEARDTAQEIFVQVYRKLDAFVGDDPTPWLMRIARNLCIDRLRRIRARPPSQDVDVGEDVELTAEESDPEAGAEARERTRLLHRALGRMSEAGREMILLKEIQGLPLQEIAALLDLPLGTVKSRSARARVELAKCVVTLEPGYGATGTEP